VSLAQELELRRRHVGPSLSLAYDTPLEIVRGEGASLFDSDGRRYLDLVNNVCHVGHCHPRVVQAGIAQMQALNTNTRYVHPNLARYAERLAGTLPDPLSVCFFVCSGSEANDLALRLARTATGVQPGNEVVAVVGGAYHGNLSSLIALSPYKYGGPGGLGRSSSVIEAPMPDPYRGRFRGPDSGPAYARELSRLISAAVQQGRRLSAFYCESILGCGGQIELPAGYLAQAFANVRQAGGLCIADEIQVGFGRVGSHMWAFERHGVVPDIVTLGKPIGNGHPMAAVVTTRKIADAFANGMEYFNTFGGNPVSCAIGLAVLDVIEDEDLQAHAARMGTILLAGLRKIQSTTPQFGDVRGAGLFLGVELVKDPISQSPADAEAHQIIELLKERGILLSVDGPLHNVLKLKPPLVLSEEDVRFFLAELSAVVRLVF
jgi:4-aminobutyrate aminotransferase-like enzyme